MTDQELEQEARSLYRIISDPSWQVQRNVPENGGWLTGYFCANEEAAKKRLEMCVERYIASSKMTPEERIESILR